MWSIIGVCALAALSGCSHSATQRGDESGSEIAPATDRAVGDQATAEATPAPTSTAATSTTSTETETNPAIEWSELPPIDGLADLVPESYNGTFLAYATVIDEGERPILCTPTIAASLPPQCNGAPIEGWNWDAVEHDEQAGSRWGQYVLIGRWDGTTFTLTQPAAPVDWSQVNTLVPEPEPSEVPCPEPDGGWWSDITDPQRVGSEDYNAAIETVNSRSELVSIELVIPEQPRPAEVQLLPSDVGWNPGVLVVRLSAVQDGDEETLRTHWGGPVCLAVAEQLSRDALTDIADDVILLENDIAPDTGFLGVGTADGEVQVGVWVATVEAQRRLDEEFGAEVVRLTGLLWAID